MQSFKFYRKKNTSQSSAQEIVFPDDSDWLVSIKLPVKTSAKEA